MATDMHRLPPCHETKPLARNNTAALSRASDIRANHDQLCSAPQFDSHREPSIPARTAAPDPFAPVSLREAVDTYEKNLIQNALATSKGNRAKAARLLQTTERILNYKIKRLQIDYARYREQ